MDRTTRSDVANFACVSASCAAAHAFPFLVLVLAYAILGPAHYLTEISWLEGRRYFSSRLHTAILPICVAACLGLVFVADARIKGIVLLACILCAVACVAPGSRRSWIALSVTGALVLALLLASPPTALLVAILVPSIVHVYLFTGAFMLAGAIRSGRVSSWVVLGAFVLASTSFVLPDPVVRPEVGSLKFWDDVANSLRALSGDRVGVTQVFGFLSFAYLFHYLNWAAKAEVIRWHDIPRNRLGPMVCVYAMTLAAYAYDYTTGFLLMYVLSMAHVLLELPLNAKTFGSIAMTFVERRRSLVAPGAKYRSARG